MRVAQITRRHFLGTAAAAVALPASGVRAAAKYKRSIVSSPEGQKALASYAKGVEAMLKLPADDPRNWFRNAFVHLMDCPHGNWWFYVWHRGYIGYLEQTIRMLSRDPEFALPYWDWTAPLTQQPPQSPGIPDALFNGVLTPTDVAFKPYTEALGAFNSFIRPGLESYWKTLTAAQRGQLEMRNYKTLDDVWKDVTGNGVPGNQCFAPTSAARYLSKTNPLFDKDTASAVAVNTVLAGLLAPKFYDSVGELSGLGYLSFASSKTASHVVQPDNITVFSVLEGQPHNLVHNCIGGVGPLDPGPYGNMTNFLSPVDPVFFLHHANMDRLWDVWTRKQISLRQPYLPTDDDLKSWSDEPFRFFFDPKTGHVLDGKARDYVSTDRFDYEYDRAGTGENLVGGSSPIAAAAGPVVASAVVGNTASVRFPAAALPQRLAAGQGPRQLVAQVTLERPAETRQFRVFVGAPAGAADLGTDSPFYVGTVGFFGAPMAGMQMSHEAAFSVPLPPTLPAFATPLAAAETHANLAVTVLPVGGNQAAPLLKAVSIGAL
jgi:tyrosinase